MYIGGNFTNVSGVTRTRLAAIRASNGAVLDWQASADGGGRQVTSLAMTPDRSKLVVGGQFTTLNGQGVMGLGAVSPAEWQYGPVGRREPDQDCRNSCRNH